MPEEVKKENTFIVIKGRFKAIETNSFGIFLMFLDTESRNLESISVVASHFSSLYETDPKNHWSDVEEKIATLRWKGEFATSISNDIQNYLETSLRGDRSDEIYSLIKQNASSKVENILFSLLMKPLGDRNIHIDMVWETVTSEEVNQVKEARHGKDEENTGEADPNEVQPLAQEAETDFDIADGSVVLGINLILAPVSGIPIFELQPGDKIMVKIDPSTNRGKYFIDLLNATHENEVIPIPSTIEKVKVNQFNEYVILVKIGDGIFGKVLESEQVKLKRYDPDTDKKSSQPQMKNLADAGFSNSLSPTEPTGDKTTFSLYWLLALGGVIVIAAIIMIFYILVFK